MTITVKRTSQTTFKVTVKQRRTITTHRVTVPLDYWHKLTGGTTPPKTLVEKSFEFLLEREPNTSILGRFGLSEIQGYFPEYEKTIKRMLV